MNGGRYELIKVHNTHVVYLGIAALGPASVPLPLARPSVLGPQELDPRTETHIVPPQWIVRAWTSSQAVLCDEPRWRCAGVSHALSHLRVTPLKPARAESPTAMAAAREPPNGNSALTCSPCY